MTHPDATTTPDPEPMMYLGSEQAYKRIEDFNRKSEEVPKSGSLQLHRVQVLQQPYGEQEVYVSENRLYKVFKAEVYDTNARHRMAWVVITPLGDAPLHDWRVMMDFKNQLCGTETYGVEMYPAESDCWDANNNFHLWVWLDGYKPPFGMRTRCVVDPVENPGVTMLTPQRPFPVKPPRTVSVFEAQRKITHANMGWLSVREAKELIRKREEKQRRRKK